MRGGHKIKILKLIKTQYILDKSSLKGAELHWFNIELAAQNFYN